MQKLLLLASLFLLPSVTLATAQEYPTRLVTIVVPFTAGGPIDVITRLVVNPLSKELGQPVIVVNRPSAGGIVGMEFVIDSPADGYTLLAHNNSIAIVTHPKFDPLDAFKPIGTIAEVPMLLVGRRNLEPRTFPQLRSYMQKKQNSINIASSGSGTISHLCALAFLEQLNVQAQIIPYKGNAPALTDLKAGHVDLLCEQITTSQQSIVAGQINAYAVVSNRKIDSLPKLPTLHSQGLTNMDLQAWYGLYVNQSTPSNIQEHLSKALQISLKDPEFQSSLRSLGASAISNDRANPDQVTKDLIRERYKWLPLMLKDRVKNSQ